ncbi:MAG: hypothetical protein KC561_13540 [Myxococcales bacterium]|nr:hypothetical protein [Myxococcales bacterium]
MPLPRVPKIEKTPVPPESAPDWKETLKIQDPYSLGPAESWLRVHQARVPTPDHLELNVAGEWVAQEQGVWRIHQWLSPDCAVVSQDQSRLLLINRNGERTVVWEGPRLLETVGGGIWGDNWMFAAGALPDGRWVAALPATEESDRDERTWRQKLVLMSADNVPLASLLTPERSDSAVAKRQARRFMTRVIYPACGGRVIVLNDTDVLAVGVYQDRLEFIGKTVMPRLGGGVRVDGTDVLVSTSLADSKVSWFRLEQLDDLWKKKS